MKKERAFGKNWQWEKTGVGILLCLFILLRLPSLFEPLSYGDEGIYLALGQAAQKGRLWYGEIHDNKPPGIYLVAALTGDFSRYRMAYFIWSIVGWGVFWQLAKTLFPKKKGARILALAVFSVLAAVPFLEGNIANAENFFIYTTIAAAWLIFKGTGYVNLAGAGFLLAISTFFKVPAFFDLAPFLVYILWQEDYRNKEAWKKLGWLLAWVAGPHLIVFGYFGLRGAGGAYLRAAFLENIPYLSTWGKEKIGKTVLPWGIISRAGALAGLGLGLAIGVAKKKIKPREGFLILWFGVGVFAALLSSRPYPHYLFQIVPAWALGTGLLLDGGWQRGVPVIMAILIGVIFGQYGYYLYPIAGYYQNFGRFGLGQKSRDDYFAFFDDLTPDLYRAAGFLKKETRTEEEIFVWGDLPCLYSLAERLPVGRFTAAYHIKMFEKPRETISALIAKAPRYVVVVDDPVGLKGLIKFLKQGYALKKDYGKIKLYYRMKEVVLPRQL